MLFIIYIFYTNKKYIFHNIEALGIGTNLINKNVISGHIIILKSIGSFNTTIITFKWYKIHVNIYNPRPYVIVGVSYCREQFTENVNI